MRFIRGESLRDAVKKRYEAGKGLSRLELRQFLSRFVTVCETIAFAHSQGVLHRDLKPDNIMLGPFGETLVVDWGLAKSTGALETPQAAGCADRPSWYGSEGLGYTLQGSTVGTPSYMSPEQAAGHHDLQGPQSDIYGLGAVLYYILTGRSAIRGLDQNEILAKVIAGDFPRPRAVSPSVSRSLEAICLTAMAKEPANRYGSALALAKDIESWLGDDPVTAWREPLIADSAARPVGNEPGSSVARLSG